jgi:hypothetical protein
MDLDLISAIELTASAAIVVATLASAFGRDAAARIRIAAWLGAWFVLVVILGATRALHYEHGIGTPGPRARGRPSHCRSLLRGFALGPGFMVPLLFAVHIGIFLRLAMPTPPAETKQ